MPVWTLAYDKPSVFSLHGTLVTLAAIHSLLSLFYSPPGGVRSIVLSMSVCPLA